MRYQKPPDYIEVDGENYPIETDFRVWIEFSQKITNLSGEDLLNAILEFIDAQGLPATEESLQAVLLFYSCGENTEKKSENKNAYGKKSKAFDFEKDEELIFSAFLSQYHINLRKKNIHWWDFIAMFKGLKDDEKICEIMGYRTMDFNNMSNEQKSYYRKLKEKYSLDTVHYASLDERNNALRDKIKRIQKEVNGIG